MARKVSKGTRASRSAGKSLSNLQAALRKQTKEELVSVILEFARSDQNVARSLEKQFGVEPPVVDLLAHTRQAINSATYFDPRDMNHNFDFDYDAYKTIKDNFGLLIKADRLDAVFTLALDLMDLGSYQVEMSDEGLMTDYIEECFQVIAKAIRKCSLPKISIVKWCDEMMNRDRTKYIFKKELEALKQRYA